MSHTVDNNRHIVLLIKFVTYNVTVFLLAVKLINAFFVKSDK
jgi:hypothetical protein